MTKHPVLTLLALLGTIALAAWAFTLPIAWKNTSYYVLLPCFLLMLPWARRLVYTSGYRGRGRLLERVPKPVQIAVFAGFLGIVLTHFLAVASLIMATPHTQNAIVLTLEKSHRSCPMWALQLTDGRQVRLCYRSDLPLPQVSQGVTVHVRESALAYDIRPLEP